MRLGDVDARVRRRKVEFQEGFDLDLDLSVLV